MIVHEPIQLKALLDLFTDIIQINQYRIIDISHLSLFQPNLGKEGGLKTLVLETFKQIQHSNFFQIEDEKKMNVILTLFKYLS